MTMPGKGAYIWLYELYAIFAYLFVFNACLCHVMACHICPKAREKMTSAEAIASVSWPKEDEHIIMQRSLKGHSRIVMFSLV